VVSFLLVLLTKNGANKMLKTFTTKQFNSMTVEQVRESIPFKSDNVDLLKQDYDIQTFFYTYIKEYLKDVDASNIHIRTLETFDKKQNLNPIKVNPIQRLTDDKVRITILYAVNLFPFRNAEDVLITGLPFVIHELKKYQERNTKANEKTWTNAINSNGRMSVKTIGKELQRFGLELVDRDKNSKPDDGQFFSVALTDDDNNFYHPKGKQLRSKITKLFDGTDTLKTTLLGDDVLPTPKPIDRQIKNYILNCGSDECKVSIKIPKSDFITDKLIEEFLTNTVCVCESLFILVEQKIDIEHADTVDHYFAPRKVEVKRTPAETKK